MQKGQERVITGTATAVRLAGSKPAIRIELSGVLAPELSAIVDGPGGEDDFGASRNELAEDGGGDGGVADGEGDRGVEAEGFVADGVEVGHVVDDVVGYLGFCRGGNVGADLFAKSGLGVGVLAH